MTPDLDFLGFLSDSLFFNNVKKGEKSSKLSPDDRMTWEKGTIYYAEKDILLSQKLWENQAMSLPEFYRLQYVQNIHVFLVSDKLLTKNAIIEEHASQFYRSGFVGNMLKGKGEHQVAHSLKVDFGKRYAWLEQKNDLEMVDLKNKMRQLGAKQAVLHWRDPQDMAELLAEGKDMTVKPLDEYIYRQLGYKR